VINFGCKGIKGSLKWGYEHVNPGKSVENSVENEVF
jgi:hypothetical protein